MNTKNLTSFLFGYKVTSRRPPQPEMTVIVRASFTLKPGQPLEAIEGTDQGTLTAETFLEDDDERKGECLYPGDFADFKPRTDLLLKGTCHPPGGRSAPMCPVRFSGAGWSKELLVFGRRTWKKGVLSDKVSEPETFDSMPLGWTHSFGGEGFELNPVGKGFGTDTELPNVEIPQERIRSARQKPQPAGFGPINPTWPPRAAKVGKKYGKEWKATRSPYYSVDFDWTYFNAAPADQQLPEYLRGDEEFLFQNLHPEASEFSIRLPALRVRAFVKDVEGRFREVALNLDTLYADLDAETLTLTWRGLEEVRTDDMTDVTTALIASEKLDEPPLPVGPYREKLEAYEKNPLADHLPQEIQDAAAEAKAAEDEDTDLDPVSAHIKQVLGPMAPQEAAMAQKALAGIIALADKDGVDLGPKLAQAMAQAPAKANSMSSMLVGAPPPVNIRKAVGELKALADESVKAAQAAGKEIKGIEKFYAMLDSPALKKLGYRPQPEGKESQDEPGPGADLTGQDLSGRDLSGVDLSGATLDGADLTEADLTNAKLVGATLSGTILYKANLTGADLSKAKLSTSNLSEVTARGANLSEAEIEQCTFDGSDLSEATLNNLRARQCVFCATLLTGATARDATFEQTDFSEAVLEQTDLSGSTFERCLFAECKASGANMADCTLTKSSFAKAELADASFARAEADGTIWDGASLDRTDFSHATLRDSHFTEVKGKSARFVAADLRGSRLYKAVLERAEFIEANLFGADLSKGNLQGTSFKGANLYDAKFLNATVKGCSFEKANLKRAQLERPR